jgi:hypothetical protein
MGSKDIAVRERQLARAEARLTARRAELEERGVGEQALDRDPVLRKLAAEMRKAKRRVEAPQAARAHVEQVAAKIAKQGKPRPADKKKRAKPKQDAGGAKPKPKGGKGGKGGKKK